MHRCPPHTTRQPKNKGVGSMKVTVRDEKGTVREFDFIMQCAVDTFLMDLPEGWEVLPLAA